jgi:hypothetical protein
MIYMIAVRSAISNRNSQFSSPKKKFFQSMSIIICYLFLFINMRNISQVITKWFDSGTDGTKLAQDDFALLAASFSNRIMGTFFILE